MNDDKNQNTQNTTSSSDELLERSKEAFKATQQQTEEAARQLGSFLKFGAKTLKKAADAAADAIRDDLNKRQ